MDNSGTVGWLKGLMARDAYEYRALSGAEVTRPAEHRGLRDDRKRRALRFALAATFLVVLLYFTSHFV